MDRVFGRVNRISQSDFRNQKILLRFDTFNIAIKGVNFIDVLRRYQNKKENDAINYNIRSR